MKSVQLKEIKARINKLEERDLEELITILEIMSNVTFFGELKRTNCEYPKDGQCSLFYIQKEGKNKIPEITECRINECAAVCEHCHLEANNVTCTFCPQWNIANPLSNLARKSFVENER